MFDDEKNLNSQNENTGENTEPTDSSTYTDKPDYINNQNDADAGSSEHTNGNSYNNDASQNENGGSYYQSAENKKTGESYYNSTEDNSNQSYYNQNSSNNTGNNGQTYYNQNNAGRNDYSNEKNYYEYNNNYSNQNNNGKKKKGKKNAIVITSIAAAAIIIVIGIANATSSIMNSADGAFDKSGSSVEKQTTKNTEYPTINSTEKSGSTDTSTGVKITDVSDVVNNVMPSIVAITSTTKVQANTFGSDWFSGDGYGQNNSKSYEEVGAGSGIIVKQSDTELLIVTNNHVVSGADSLSIQFANGKSINGVTKSTDENADIAIVSIPLSDIDSDTMSAIKIATLGSSDDLKVGEGVVAIGNALGYGQSVTTGVISAKDREIAVDNKTMTVLQTDAAINGGNSGGALLNSKGEVIGINVAKYSSSSYSGSASIEGMGFAIPISQATDIINNLMTKQTRQKVDEAEKGQLGIKVYDVSSSDSEIYGIPQGILISEVTSGGAAEKGGLKKGDVITKFDGQSISTSSSLVDKLEYYKAGEKVNVTVKRNVNGEYKEQDIEVTLQKATDSESSSSGNNNNNVIGNR